LIKGSVFVLLTAAFFLSCGIEESYYLPQVSQGSIIRTFNTEATINFPSIDSFYYSDSYTIYYKIYISSQNESGDFSSDPTTMRNVNSQLANDFNAIYPSSDPLNTTATVNVENLFRGRGYYELDLHTADLRNKLTKNGGTLILSFPTAAGSYPVAIINNEELNLYRSKNLISPRPTDNCFFLYSTELSDSANAVTNINADVNVSASTTGTGFAYVSMYIVAVGMNPTVFTPIYSKPTHINIFRLPNAN